MVMHRARKGTMMPQRAGSGLARVWEGSGLCLFAVWAVSRWHSRGTVGDLMVHPVEAPLAEWEGQPQPWVIGVRLEEGGMAPLVAVRVPARHRWIQTHAQKWDISSGVERMCHYNPPH
jgi:hypothetical protein